MDRKELFACWAPARARWSPWVKPVLFAHAQRAAEKFVLPELELRPESVLIPAATVERQTADHPYRAPRVPGDVGVVVDLPGIASVGAGLALATLGFRPVPLFNAVPGGQQGRRFFKDGFASEHEEESDL